MLIVNDREWWWVEVNSSNKLWLLWLGDSFSVSFLVASFFVDDNLSGIKSLSLFSIFLSLVDNLLFACEPVVFVVA